MSLPSTSPGPSPPATLTSSGTSTVAASSLSSASASESSSSSSTSSSTASSTSSTVSSSSATLSSISSAPLVTSQTTDTTTTPTAPPATTPTTRTTSYSQVSRVISTRPDGGVVTITTIVDAPSSSSSSNTGNNGGKGFLQNKAAMGATFAVAGIAALVFAFLFITTYIRRRRAMKFDRDVAAAAAIAAAESQAVQPFGDDDDDIFAGVPRAQGGGYGYAPGKMAEHDPYGYLATGILGGAPGSGPGAFGVSPQPMRQQQTAGPLAYPSVQSYNQAYNGNGGVFGRQPGQEAYNMQDLGIPADSLPRPGSAGTGHGTLPGIAGVGTQNNLAGAGASGNNGFSELVDAAGLVAGTRAVSPYNNGRDDPYGGYVTSPVTSPVGESRYPQPTWSQPQQQPSQPSQPVLPEQLQNGWYQQYGRPPVELTTSPTVSASTHGPAPAYSPPGGLTAQGYPNEKSRYSNSHSANATQTSSSEGPSVGTHTAVSPHTPATPLYKEDTGSILEEREGPRVLKVTNE